MTKPFEFRSERQEKTLQHLKSTKGEETTAPLTCDFLLFEKLPVTYPYISLARTGLNKL